MNEELIYKEYMDFIKDENNRTIDKTKEFALVKGITVLYLYEIYYKYRFMNNVCDYDKFISMSDNDKNNLVNYIIYFLFNRKSCDVKKIVDELPFTNIRENGGSRNLIINNINSILDEYLLNGLFNYAQLNRLLRTSYLESLKISQSSVNFLKKISSYSDWIDSFDKLRLNIGIEYTNNINSSLKMKRSKFYRELREILMLTTPSKAANIKDNLKERGVELESRDICVERIDNYDCMIYLFKRDSKRSIKIFYDIFSSLDEKVMEDIFRNMMDSDLYSLEDVFKSKVNDKKKCYNHLKVLHAYNKVLKEKRENKKQEKPLMKKRCKIIEKK